MTFSAPENSESSQVLPPFPILFFGLSLRRRLFAADGAGMCWTFDALARWLARRVRLGSPEGRAGGQLSPQRSIDNSMTAQKQLQGSMNRLNDSPTVPPSHRRRGDGASDKYNASELKKWVYWASTWHDGWDVALA